ncbi:MlaD family protein [Aldersonia kunmingensis]|uniref:MlaD family protein n=1 Tax=Aldersonia kunmingensis TaxID=408066 RepID=UPI000A015E2D|nr:MlaD family protein [Aldersonia kunmingensis]
MRSATIAVAAVAVLAVGGIVVMTSADSSVNGCAEMADAVGLYEGNDVTMRGVKIGKVTGVSAEGGHVRVGFRLDREVDFPADVSAVTTSESIVTDRRLEIPSGNIAGPKWDMAECIPLDRTHTPKSVSAAFTAFDKLSEEVTEAAASSPEQQQLVREAMNNLDTSLKGSAGDFNAAVAGLAAALGDPALRDSQLRSLLTNVDELTGYFLTRWPDLELGLTELGSFAETFDAWFTELNPTVVETTKLMPTLLRLIRSYAPNVFAVLDPLVADLDPGQTQAFIDTLNLMPQVSAGLRRIAAAPADGPDLVVKPGTVDARLLQLLSAGVGGGR